MSDIRQNIGNAILSSFPILAGDTNAPDYYTDRREQYFSTTTQAFFEERLPLASDFFEAECQGLDYADFYAWQWVKIRLADIVKASSLTNLAEDYKMVIFAHAIIDYWGRGAKLHTAGNTYICYNPSNASSITANGLVRRCNALWNYLDYYGNIQTEPFCWTKPGALATANYAETYGILPDAYQHCIMQLNSGTAWITENTRVILGDLAYKVQGMQNFSLEFSDDTTSAHMMQFDLYITQTTENDDMTNKVADANSFSWQINVSGAATMNVGATQTLTATSTRNGEAPDATIYPYSYIWSTSDENVATVNSGGLVTALSQGDCTLTCTLEQNPSISTTLELTVEQAVTTDYVQFTTMPPSTLEQYETATATAYYFINGEQQTDTVTFSFSGANPNSYEAQTADNTATIMCYAADNTPLTITATCNGKSATAQVQLIGY